VERSLHALLRRELPRIGGLERIQLGAGRDQRVVDLLEPHAALGRLAASQRHDEKEAEARHLYHPLCLPLSWWPQPSSCFPRRSTTTPGCGATTITPRGGGGATMTGAGATTTGGGPTTRTCGGGAATTTGGPGTWRGGR